METPTMAGGAPGSRPGAGNVARPTGGTVTSATPPGPGHPGWAATPTGAQVGLAPVASAMRKPVNPPRPSAPEPARLIAVCTWAAALGFAGMVLAIRGWLGYVAGNAAGWYLPIMSVLGVLGIMMTAASFLSVRDRRTPWNLLGSATGVLLVATVITAIWS